MEPIALNPLPPCPLVSVLIANHNYARFVGRAIESVLSQTYEHVEVCVCDDGSTDNSVAVIAGYAARDPRVLVRCQENGGQASAWNAAFAASRGDVICLLDADDAFAPTKVEEVVRCFADDPSAGVVTHPMVVVGADGSTKQRIPLYPPESGWLADRIIHRGGRWRSTFGSAICFRRELADLLFPIPVEPFRTGADSLPRVLLPLLTCVGRADRAETRYYLHGANQYSGGRVDLLQVRRALGNMERLQDPLNERLVALGYPQRQIDMSRHLNHADLSYLAGVLEGAPRRALLRPLMALLYREIRDDLDRPPQKVLKIVSRAVVLLLPRRGQVAWLSWTATYGRPKEIVRRLASARWPPRRQ